MPLYVHLIINRIKVLLLLGLCVFDTNVFAFITEVTPAITNKGTRIKYPNIALSNNARVSPGSERFVR